MSTQQINKPTAVYGDYLPWNQTAGVKGSFDHWWGSQQPWGLSQPWTICWIVMPEPCWETRNVFIRGSPSKPGLFEGIRRKIFSDFGGVVCLLLFFCFFSAWPKASTAPTPQSLKSEKRVMKKWWLTCNSILFIPSTIFSEWLILAKPRARQCDAGCHGISDSN